jgi:hypothetical protein
MKTLPACYSIPAAEQALARQNQAHVVGLILMTSCVLQQAPIYDGLRVESA